MNWTLLWICITILTLVVMAYKCLYKETKTFRGVAYDKENKRKIIYSGHFGRDGRVIINESYVEKDEKRMSATKDKSCPKCGKSWNYYSSMLTGACLNCNNHYEGVFWTKEDFENDMKNNEKE